MQFNIQMQTLLAESHRQELARQAARRRLAKKVEAHGKRPTTVTEVVFASIEETVQAFRGAHAEDKYKTGVFPAYAPHA